MDYFSDFDSLLGNLIDSVKMMLYTRHPDIFERLDFSDDRPFLEPLLYTYLSQKENRWLDSILYCYDKQTKDCIDVFSNDDGVVYIPELGYFKTAMPNQKLSMRTTGTDGVHEFYCEDRLLAVEFEPPQIGNYGIEIIRHHHPLLSTVFTEQGTAIPDVAIGCTYERHLESFNKGLKIIQECNPLFFDMLLKTLRKVMLFNSDKQNSFAVLAAHHMIFLNVNSWDSEVYFADHISHEGSHVVYNTLTFTTKNKLFACDPMTPLGDLAGNPNDKGSVYSRFHGMFTYVGITEVLYRYFKDNDLQDLSYMEAAGRFIFHMQSFSVVFQAFDSIDIFQDEGRNWYLFFKSHFKKLEPVFARLDPHFDLSNQPYDFNSRLFFETNHFIEPVRL